MLSLFNNCSQDIPYGGPEDVPTTCPGTFQEDVLQNIIEADKASIRKGIYEVLRTSIAAMTHLLIFRMSSIWPRRAEDILTVVVVVVDFGP